MIDEQVGKLEEFVRHFAYMKPHPGLSWEENFRAAQTTARDVLAEQGLTKPP